jgi:hypothetical protein
MLPVARASRARGLPLAAGGADRAHTLRRFARAGARRVACRRFHRADICSRVLAAGASSTLKERATVFGPQAIV